MNKEYEQMYINWKNNGTEKIMDLAFWTMWKSRWAKTWHVRSLAPGAKRSECEKKSKKHYKDKEKAFVLMSKEADDFGFYRPKTPGKVNIEMCNDHFQEATMDMMFYGVTPIELYKQEPEKYNKCPNCKCIYEPDYYSLYYLAIKRDGYVFSFHIPYQNGRDFLPPPTDLPLIQQVENEGAFRFGRPLYKKEEETYTEEDVNKMFKKAFLIYKKTG